MPTISGSLNLVTDRPVDSISEVWVRARETRGQGDGLVVGVNDRVSVTGGVVEFTALPGAAVLVLVQTGIPIDTLPIIVSDMPTQSLRLVVQAAQAASDAQLSVLEELAAEVAGNLIATEDHRTAAEQARDDATEQAGLAKQAADSAVDDVRSELDGLVEQAGASESNAKASETNAGIYAVEAGAAEYNAKVSETNAGTYSEDADSHATRAEQARDEAIDARGDAVQAKETTKGYRDEAEGFAISASESDTSAHGHRIAAQQAASDAEEWAQMADPDGWRQEITQQLADIVEGAPEDLDTLREIAEYAQENRDITDQLNQAIGNKANKGHTHTTAQVDGLDDALDGKANAVHTHAVEQVDGLDAALAGKADAVHTHTSSQVDGLDAALARLSNIRAWFRGEGPPPASIPGAQVGDWWLDETSMELHEITEI